MDLPLDFLLLGFSFISNRFAMRNHQRYCKLINGVRRALEEIARPPHRFGISTSIMMDGLNFTLLSRIFFFILFELGLATNENTELSNGSYENCH